MAAAPQADHLIHSPQPKPIQHAHTHTHTCTDIHTVGIFENHLPTYKTRSLCMPFHSSLSTKIIYFIQNIRLDSIVLNYAFLVME